MHHDLVSRIYRASVYRLLRTWFMYMYDAVALTPVWKRMLLNLRTSTALMTLSRRVGHAPTLYPYNCIAHARHVVWFR